MLNVTLACIGSFSASWVTSTMSLLLNDAGEAKLVPFTIKMYFLFQIIGCISYGLLSDLVGRKKCYVASSLVASLGILLEFLVIREDRDNSIDGVFLILDTQLRYFGSVGGVALLGLGVGGVYVIAGIFAAESQKDSRSLISTVALVFCQEGVSHFVFRCCVSILFISNPSLSLSSIFPRLLCASSFFFLTPLILLVLQYNKTTLSRESGQSSFLLHDHQIKTNYVDPLLETYTARNYGNTYTPSPTSTLTSVTRDLKLSTEYRREMIETTQRMSMDNSLVHRVMLREVFARKFRNLLGCCLPWLIFGFIYHENGTINYFLKEKIQGFESDQQENLFALAVSLVSLMGYILASYMSLRMNVKLTQILGFILLSFVYFGIAVTLYSVRVEEEIYPKLSHFVGASLIFNCVFRFFHFIPSLTCYYISFTSFPSEVRGITAGLAVGALYIGALISWEMSEFHFSRPVLLITSSGIAVLGAVLTQYITPSEVISSQSLGIIVT